MTQRAESLPNDSPDSAARQRKRLRHHLRYLAAALTAVVIAVMVALGAFIIVEYRSLQLKSYAKIGSVYIDNFLVPFAEANPDGFLDADSGAQEITRGPSDESSHLLMRIWRLDGTVSYSNFEDNEIEKHDDTELNIALAGNFVAELKTGSPGEIDFPMNLPFFEVYAPITDPVTGGTIAVGEVYFDASEILRGRAFVERAVWAGVSLVTLAVLAMLALSFNQSRQLRQRLEVARRLARQNSRLRHEADQARVSAAQANEEVLNLIGAELHDGPVQLLGLMSLMGSEKAYEKSPDNGTFHSLIEEVMTQLRAMSAGLILPELEDLDAYGVVALAVERHRARTGKEVILEVDLRGVQLDMPRRVCLFRIVQEGLNNAVRHGDGTPPNAIVKASNGNLEIRICNGGVGFNESTAGMPSWRLGLQGMRRRLEPFGGAVDLFNTDAETILHAKLPIDEEL